MSDNIKLRTPEARVLAELLNGACLTRTKLNQRIGFSELSGTVNFALNGMKIGPSSSKHYPGLLALKLVTRTELDIDGLKEWVYEITPLGREALQSYLDKRGGEMPPMRSKEDSTNSRYKGVK